MFTFEEQYPFIEYALLERLVKRHGSVMASFEGACIPCQAQGLGHWTLAD